MSKYDLLWKYVSQQDTPSFSLTFAEMERISGVPLDHSFLTCKRELIAYGYQVGKISMKQQKVEFRRLEEQQR